MEPIPESESALGEYLSFGETDTREQLMRLGGIARKIVPELVGLSLTVVEQGLTFTLVASDAEAASIDFTQYAEDGPCQRGLETGQVIEEDIDDLLDERRWLAFASASAARGVASSLSLPILQDGKPVFGLNLYAGTAGAFTGRHEELADAMGASAADIVTNADLSFSTRMRAIESIAQLDEQRILEVAVGTIAASRRLPVEDARELVVRAAARAGLRPVAAARLIVAIWEH